MAAPNIVNVSNILGKTAIQAVATSATAIVTNASNSNKVFKVNALYVSNINTLVGKITVDLFRGGIAYRIVNLLTVPANASIDVITKSIYLEEGDTLRLTADAANFIQAVCSFEEIS
jgi:hypothetical protein